MRTVTIYEFDELSKDAQTTAVNEIKTQMEEDEQSEALYWAIDDCSLFEPKHSDMASLFGEDYTNQMLGGGFLFKNTRNQVQYNDLYTTCEISKALEIQDEKMFKKWLGIPQELIDKSSYEIYEDCGETSITIKIDEAGDDDIDSENMGIQKGAEDKFHEHISSIAKRIEASIAEYFSEANVIEKISNNPLYEFTEDGYRFV
jgi:hypothetical protein